VPDPLVVVDTSLIHEGTLDDVEALAAELVAFVDANEDRILAYRVHIDAAERRMTVLQVHPDSASMEMHMQVAGPVFSKFAGLLELQRVDFYGSPSARLLQQMQAKALLLGNAPVVVNPLHAGLWR
jgi:quinol monooxygenase YgiN